MFTTDPHTALRIANDRHRELIAAAALRRSVPVERLRRHAGLRLTRFWRTRSCSRSSEARYHDRPRRRQEGTTTCIPT